MPDKPQVSDAVGTRLLFENEAVRVWDLRLEPGETIPLHRHTLDYLYVVIGDGTLQTIDAEGHRKPTEPSTDGEVQFRLISGESVHAAQNIGDTPWRNIVVELKRSAACDFPDKPGTVQEQADDAPDSPGIHG